MEVIIIQEEDLQDFETSILGVATSVENADKIISDYYGEFKELSKEDIRDSGIEYSKILEVIGCNGIPFKVKILLQWFTLNEI
jgi:hypothetical protein